MGKEPANNLIEKVPLTHSVFGIISIILGIIGFFITLFIIYILSQITGDIAKRNTYIWIYMVRTLNIFDKAEIVIKFAGVLTAVVGLLQRNKRKIFAIVGMFINVLSILFTICVMYGFI